MTAEEQARLRVLQVAGGDQHQLRVSTILAMVDDPGVPQRYPSRARSTEVGKVSFIQHFVLVQFSIFGIRVRSAGRSSRAPQLLLRVHIARYVRTVLFLKQPL